MATNSRRSNKRRSEIAEENRKRQKRKELTPEQKKERRQKRKEFNKKRKKRSTMSLGKKILLAICIILLVLVLVAIWFVATKMSKINTVELDPDKLNIYSDLQYDETGYLNVAVFGLDTRDNNDEMGTRSDTIMVVSLNRETKEVKIASVYRDTLLQHDDGTYNKANAAYSFGGVTEAIALLNKNLDLDIQHYVAVDFEALVYVINALGGIEVDVMAEELYYINGYGLEITENTGVTTEIVTTPGVQVLDGVQATAYARIRHVGNGDYQRTERQRYVLGKVLEKAQQADLGAINTIIDQVFPLIETNFSMTEILAYAKDIYKYVIGETVGFPFDKDTMIYGDAGDCVIPLTLMSNVEQLHTYLFPELSYTPSYNVQVISGDISSIYNGKERTLSLDGRIILDKIPNAEVKARCEAWMMQIADSLELATPIRQAITGVVFEVRQGYKSKDSKRQNADIANAANAYANGYIPCLMVMSAQIDDDIVARYNVAKWAILQGHIDMSATASTFTFFKQVIGFDFVQFMNDNQEYFKEKIQHVLEQLMRAE